MVEPAGHINQGGFSSRPFPRNPSRLSRPFRPIRRRPMPIYRPQGVPGSVPGPGSIPQAAPQPSSGGIDTNKIIMIAVVFLGIVMLVIAGFWFFTRPVCGNGKLEKGETSATCCQDAGCDGEQTCRGNRCEDPECGECEYLENHRCRKYQCCDNDKCYGNQECRDHTCQEVVCTGCQYATNHACAPAACCEDSDCNDNNESTMDKCLQPGTSTSRCEHASHECLTDSDCDDNDVSTADACSGEPKACSHAIITTCTSGDNYCPSGCGVENDTDCVPPVLDCGEDWDCFITASDTCTLASFIHDASFTVDGIDYDTEVYYELQGTQTNRCAFYMKLQDANIDFTSSLIGDLQGLGISDDDINSLEGDISGFFDDMAGADAECRFSKLRLMDALERWEDDNYTGIISCHVVNASSWSCNNTEEYDDGNCEGALFGDLDYNQPQANYSDNIWLALDIDDDTISRRYKPFSIMLQVHYNQTGLDGLLVFNLTPFGGIGSPIRVSEYYSSQASMVEWDFRAMIKWWEDEYISARCFENESDYTLSLYYFNCSDVEEIVGGCNSFDPDEFADGDYEGLYPIAFTSASIEVRDNGDTYSDIYQNCEDQYSSQSEIKQCIRDDFIAKGCIDY